MKALLALLALAIFASFSCAATLTLTRVAPSSDPDINSGGTFVRAFHVSCGGATGTCGTVVVYPQYCVGSGCSNYTDMPTSGAGLTSNLASYTLPGGTMNRSSWAWANFTVTGNSANTYKVLGRATSSGGNPSSTAQAVTVRTPAALTATMGATPASVTDGGTITVTMNVTNTGQRMARGVQPLTMTVNVVSGTASATLVTGPVPTTANITGGSLQTFTWTYTASGGLSGGSITFSDTAAGTDNKTNQVITSSTATSNAVTVAGKFVSAALTTPVSDPDINTGQTFLLNVTVTCSSGACANVVVYPRYCTGSLSCTPDADITTGTTDLTSNVNSVSLGTVSAGSPQTASFTITGNTADLYMVGGRFTSTPNNGNATGTQGVSVKSPSSLSATISASPSSVTDGDNITVVMNVSNSGGRGAINVTPSGLTIGVVSGTAGTTHLAGPSPLIANITGGGWQLFNWTYNASSGADGGNITFTGNASGKDNKTGATVSSGNATSNQVKVNRRNSSLAVWDDTDALTRYPGDQVHFYANYTMANGTIIDGNGVCQISFNITGGWTAFANMSYNTSSTPYYYNRSFTDVGTFNFNVTCSKAPYVPQNATSNFAITTPPATVTTGKAGYAGCRMVYYRVRLLDASHFLVDSGFNLAVTDPSNIARQSGTGISPNNGTGVYLGNYGISSAAADGLWYVTATIPSATAASVPFTVGH